ncbi:4-coumarate--CoA ligase-like 5 isoform X1 [Canna indica]|uniref:4-coumarate--CoA ligase-like 5 isoform X1 n=1 Tax=Canna indica TaxID=4628 RepID=A0AAQ3KMG0_9LILI|nr:4-coumarate--CoA ligase-like 5 isoform X1 [Canna indica]
MATVPLFHAYGFLICAKAVAVRDTVVIQTKRFDAKRTLAAVERFRVTNLALAPPAVLAIVRVIENDEEMGGGGSYDLSSLRIVHCGGAPLALQLIERFMTKLPNVGLSQSTQSLKDEEAQESRLKREIGRGLLSSAFLLERLAGKGNIHTFIMMGHTYFKGYIGDQDATSEILNSEGWLRTGDLCYIDEDGFFYLVDRLKELIKYKGYHVPPAELENLLQTHPEIIQAAVVPSEFSLKISPNLIKSLE